MPTPAPQDPFSHPALSDSLRTLACRGVLRSYRKGALLIHEGDIGDTLFIILAGRLRAFSVSETGDREITYDSYGPGEYVGEMGLDGGPRSAHVEAVEASTCAMVTRRTLQAHLAEQPDFAFELLAKVISRAREATRKLRSMGLSNVYGRLKLLLQQLAAAQPDGSFVIAELPRHWEIAAQLGCGREMVGRVLGDLHRGGYIEYIDKRHLRFRQLPAGW